MNDSNRLRSLLRTNVALSDFIESHLNDPDLGWPHKSPSRCSGPRRSVVAEAAARRLLVVGALDLELPVTVQATTKIAAAALRNGYGGFKWELGEPNVGGFAAYVARAASALGVDVSICTTVPIPMPRRFAEFFSRYDPDAKHVSALPGFCSVTFKLHCKDGVVVHRRNGTIPLANINVRCKEFRKYDAIVLDTSRCHVVGCGDDGRIMTDTSPPHAIAIAIRARKEWAATDARLAQERHSWTFLDARDVRQMFRGLVAVGENGDDVTLARRVQIKHRIPRIVLTAGSNVALLRNDDPEVHWVRSCPIACPKEAGAEETLVSVTTLSSAIGADDLTSLERGVVAAVGYKAGLDLPCCLEELDVG